LTLVNCANASNGENPQAVVHTARSSYKEYSFNVTVLMDTIGKGGAKESVQSTTQRNPTPTNDGQPLKTDKEIIVVDLRDKITGKPAPAKLDLTTKPEIILSTRNRKSGSGTRSKWSKIPRPTWIEGAD
jgi:hypothetical protein